MLFLNLHFSSIFEGKIHVHFVFEILVILWDYYKVQTFPWMGAVAFEGVYQSSILTGIWLFINQSLNELILQNFSTEHHQSSLEFLNYEHCYLEKSSRNS